MSNIAKAFANGKAFIPFVTCGDPDLETTATVVRAMAAGGSRPHRAGDSLLRPYRRGPCHSGGQCAGAGRRDHHGQDL